MINYKNICIVCGNEFIPKRKDSRICSKECLKKFKPKENRLDKESTCVICGNVFKPKTAIQKTCCRKCGDIFRINNYKLKECNNKNIEKNKTLKMCKCLYCGNEFKVYGRTKSFCNSHCYYKYNYKPSLVNNTCEFCGKEFISKRKSKYCSSKCKRKSNPLYTLHHRPYKNNNSKILRIYRNKIGDRDNWICNICGNKIDKNLKYPNPMSSSIDHIIPLSKGGTHTEDNVHIAHLYCNCIIKKDKIRPQG